MATLNRALVASEPVGEQVASGAAIELDAEESAFIVVKPVKTAGSFTNGDLITVNLINDDVGLTTMEWSWLYNGTDWVCSFANGSTPNFPISTPPIAMGPNAYFNVAITAAATYTVSFSGVKFRNFSN